MPPSPSSPILSIFADICLPIFGMIALGWLLDRRRRLDLGTLVRINLYGFVPAFIFVAVVESPAPGALALQAIGFTVAVIVSMGLLSDICARLLRLPAATRQSMKVSTMCYNCGNYGVPLVALAWPADGPVIQVFVLMTMNIMTFSVVPFLLASGSAPADGASPDRRQRLLSGLGAVIRMPSLYAIIAALLLRGAGLGEAVQEIDALWKPLEYLHRGLVGLALLTLGVQLSQTRPAPFRGPLAWALGLRLVGGPLVAAGLVLAFGIPAPWAPILVAGAAAPTAVNTALLAHEFRGDVSYATSAVFYSTLASLVTVTATLALLQGWTGA